MERKIKKVAVIGLGYIGLPVATMLSDNGLDVIGVDIQSVVVDSINKGDCYIDEPDLACKLKKNVANKKLKAQCNVETADAYIIAVPTPINNNNSPDLSFVYMALEALIPVVKKGDLIILESTSPIGTTNKVAKYLFSNRPDLKAPTSYLSSSNLQSKYPEFSSENSDIDYCPSCRCEPKVKQSNFNIQAEEMIDVNIAYCPERVLPGNIIHELINNDRIVGGITQQCRERAKDLYKKFVKADIVLTDPNTAEMVKLVENSYRDVNIAFANELSMIADEFNIDVLNVIKFANQHPRVNILNPGPGVGGHCIAVDPLFMVDSAPMTTHLIKTARQVNDNKACYVAQKIKKVAKNFNSPTITFFGLSYKPNVQDLRSSPSIEIIKQVSDGHYGGTLRVIEPHIKELPSTLVNLTDVYLFESIDKAIEDSDIVVFLVKHDLFLNIDFGKVENKVVIDTCGFIQSINRKQVCIS